MKQTLCTVVKSKGKISQNFVAFSEYMNFTISFIFVEKREGQVSSKDCPSYILQAS